MQLFGAPDAELGETPLPEFQPPPPTPTAAQDPWIEVIKSIIFWIVFLGVVFFSIYHYYREHQEAFQRLKKIPVFAPIFRFWRWLKGVFGTVNQHISAVVDAGVQRLRSRRQAIQAESRQRFISLRRLSPREKIQFYYLAMVRRGNERGVTRKAAQTPYEYSRDLSQMLDYSNDASKMTDRKDLNSVSSQGKTIEDVERLTDYFVEARYSLHEMTSQDAGTVKRYWDHIRRILRKPFRSKDR
jgi:hypothetical protein